MSNENGVSVGGVSSAEYQRAWRAKHGAQTGKPGRPVTAACPSVAAYKRHKRTGDVCADPAGCRAEYLADQRRLYAARKARGVRG